MPKNFCFFTLTVVGLLFSYQPLSLAKDPGDAAPCPVNPCARCNKISSGENLSLPHIELTSEDETGTASRIFTARRQDPQILLSANHGSCHVWKARSGEIRGCTDDVPGCDSSRVGIVKGICSDSNSKSHCGEKINTWLHSTGCLSHDQNLECDVLEGVTNLISKHSYYCHAESSSCVSVVEADDKRFVCPAGSTYQSFSGTLGFNGLSEVCKWINPTSSNHGAPSQAAP